MLDLQTYLVLVVRAWLDQRFNLCDTSDHPTHDSNSYQRLDLTVKIVSLHCDVFIVLVSWALK